MTRNEFAYVTRSAGVPMPMIEGFASRHGHFPNEARVLSGISRFPALATKRSEPAGNLTGGRQQRVATARESMARPEVLLLDEPSMGRPPSWPTRFSGSSKDCARKAWRSSPSGRTSIAGCRSLTSPLSSSRGVSLSRVPLPSCGATRKFNVHIWAADFSQRRMET